MNLGRPLVGRVSYASFSFLGRKLPIVLLVPGALLLLATFVYTASQLERAVSSSSVFIASYAAFALVGLGLFALRAKTAANKGVIKEGGRFSRWYVVGVLLSLTAAVWALWFSDVSLSPWFALCLSVALALLAVQTVASSGRKHSVVSLAQILLVGAVLRIAPYSLNPYVYASDTYFHYTIVQATISTGHFVGPGPYAYYPGYHVFNAAALLVTGLPPTAFAFIDLSAIILSLLLVYVIGKRLLSERAGLLAALFLVFGNFYFPSASYQPTYLGIVTMMTALAALALHFGAANRGAWIIFWFANIVTLLIHPINYVVLALILLAAYLALARKRGNLKASGIPVVSTSVIFVSYIVYISVFLFQGILLGIFETGGTGLTPNVSGAASLLSTYTAELTYAYLGIAMKAALVVPGVLFLLERRAPQQNWLALSTIFLVAVPFVGFFGGVVSSLQLTRFLLYLDVFIVFPLAVITIRLLAGSGRKRASAVVVTLILGLAFLSLTSYITSDTGGFMTTAVPTQPVFIDPGSLSSYPFLSRIPNGSTVAMDWGSLQYLAASSARGPHHLYLLNTVLLNPAQGCSGYDALSLTTASRGVFTAQGLLKMDVPGWLVKTESTSNVSRLFDSGSYLVFKCP